MRRNGTGSRQETQTQEATTNHQQQEMQRHYLIGSEWARTRNGMKCFLGLMCQRPQRHTINHDQSECDHFGNL